jgi:putative transposase
VRCFRLIEAERAQHPVSLLCGVLGVSRAGFYAWKDRRPCRRERRDRELIELIHEIHAESRGSYGWPRMHAELRHRGVNVSRKRVARLMRQAGLSGLVRRRRGKTTIRVPGVRPAPDLVGRDFTPPGPNRLWTADLTEVTTWEGKLYLAVVVDCYSRRCVGWAMAEHMRAELVVEALEMAVWQRKPDHGLIHHSDQGSQGGFNRSSQRSIERSCDGREATGSGSGWEAGDAFAGASAGGEGGASSAVLGGHRARAVE